MTRHALLAISIGLIASGLGGCASVELSRPLVELEQWKTYEPDKFPNGNWRPRGLDPEDAWFRAKDGTPLHGWYMHDPNPREVVLFAHGRATNVTDYADEIKALNKRHDVAVLVFDYRGFGRSQGEPTEEGIVEDARAARFWLAERTGVAEDEIIIMGYSLGGGVAVELAAADGAKGLVLINTFTSLPDVASFHVPWLPVHWGMINQFDSESRITKYHGPLLQIHGDADQAVPYELGMKLHQLHPGPKRFVTIPGGDHFDIMSNTYHEALDDFFDWVK